MSFQYGTRVQNNQLDQISVTTGPAAKLRIYTGTPPTDCQALPTGDLLIELALPATWMKPATAGQKTLAGVWKGVAIGAGEAGYFRIWDQDVSVCHVQGGVGRGAGTLELDNANIAVNQTLTIPEFTIEATNV